MFASLGKLAYRHHWLILIIGLLFAIASAAASYKLSENLKIGGFIDPSSDSNLAAQLAESQLDRDQGLMVVLFTAKTDLTVDRPEYRQDVKAVLERFKGVPGVGDETTYYNTGLAQFVSNDRKSTYAVVGLPGDDDTQFKTIERLHPLFTDTPLLQVRVGGRPTVNYEIVKQSEVDLLRAELFTFPIVGLMLFLIFRSVVAAFLPLLLGGTAILGAYLILRIASTFTDVSIFALNIITMLGLGLSIDYSLFVISRFREELKIHRGRVSPALVRTMQTAGHTVFFSGLTVIISLLSLLVFEPQFLKSMGFGGAAAVLVAMVASLTILPAILALLGEKVNFLSLNTLLPKRRKEKPMAGNEVVNTGYWYRTSQFVMRHPILVLVLTLVPLLAIGSPFLRINFSTFDARTLPDDHASRQVSNILDTQFPVNETSPIEIVAFSLNPALEQSSLESLFDLTRRLQALPGVARVDSLVTIDPNMDKAAYVAFYSEANRNQNPQAAQLAQRFSKGYFSLINVIFKDNKFASSTQDLVRTIRQINPPGRLVLTVGGETASLVDLLSSLARSLPLAFGLIVLILFVLLYLMLGSLVVPLKAVILNILSLSACFGTLVWVFQDGNFADWLGFTRTGTIDSTQPVLIFAGAFGLSLDYEVFLLSRIKEHYDRTNDLRSSVALGVQKTGGIITSAALLLVVVIGSFVTGEVLFIKQIGLGLAVAILVDATVVRTLLLPASMRLMGKYNWWAPGPLVKLHHKLGLAEKEPELEPEFEEEGEGGTIPLLPTPLREQSPLPSLQPQLGNFREPGYLPRLQSLIEKHREQSPLQRAGEPQPVQPQPQAQSQTPPPQPQVPPRFAPQPQLHTGFQAPPQSQVQPQFQFQPQPQSYTQSQPAEARPPVPAPIPPARPEFSPVRPSAREPGKTAGVGGSYAPEMPGQGWVPAQNFSQLPDELRKEELLDLVKKELLNPAGPAGLPVVRINQLTQLAELCKSMGQDNEAIEYYEQSLKLMRETGFDEQNQVIVLTQLSNLYLEVHSSEKGLTVSLIGVRLSRRTGQAAAEFTFLTNLVEFSLKMQELKQAKSFAWQALQLAQSRFDAPRLRRAERILAGVEAREELQFHSHTLTGFHSITGSFKSMTGQFNLNSRPAAQPAGPDRNPTPAPGPAEQAEALFKRGLQLQNERDYYQAIEVYRQALGLNPRLLRALLNRADCFKALGEADEALKDYNQALEIERNDPAIWLNLGKIFFQKRDYNQAIQTFSQAISLNPNHPEAYLNRAEAYRQQIQLGNAANDLQKFIMLSKESNPGGVRVARALLARIEEKAVL